MRTIPRHHSEIYLPLFAWADTRRMEANARTLTGYRVSRTLEVQAIWGVVRNG